LIFWVLDGFKASVCILVEFAYLGFKRRHSISEVILISYHKDE